MRRVLTLMASLGGFVGLSAAMLLGQAPATAQQQTRQDGVATANKIDAGFLQSLPTVGAASQMKDTKAEAAGFTCWVHMAVNYPGGNPIPVRATAVSVYASDLNWHFASGSNSVITSPSGSGAGAGGGWQYPNAAQFSIVIYQGGNYWQVNSLDSNNPTKISGLTNTQDIFVAVNDTQGNYGDNWGSYYICLRVDAQ
jgi:hypothetical protein